jgi:alpha-glucosidase
VWITPFYPSPQADHGYDVADYRDVDPMFGTLADFDEMLETAHKHGIRVVVDIVPNHSSDDHVWFKEALAAGPGSPERERYIFRTGRGEDGSIPPNNWMSTFGGSAWTRTDDGQWYLHLFDHRQPDFNWDNPEVGDEFESILRFWLDRGVDGFRIDVAHGMVKAEGLPDVDSQNNSGGLEAALAERDRPYWDQPAVHEIYRRWRRVLDEYPGDRMAVAEAWVSSADSMARYVRPDELQQVFNFNWLEAPWSADAFRAVIEATFAAVDPVDATPTWVLSNHDVERHVSRYGGGTRGLARGRAATLTMLGLPGSGYLYAGEELGLPQVDVPDEHRQDPTWHRGGGVGRDGCRVPIPWASGGTSFGFGPDDGKPAWLPQPPSWAELSVETEEQDPESTLSFYRRVLKLRRRLVPGLGRHVEFLGSPREVLAFRRSPDLVCVVNCGTTATDVSGYGRLVVASGASDEVSGGSLPPDTAAWFQG